MGIGPLFSSTWFPPHQRTTATAVLTTLNIVGASITYLTGPALVPNLYKGGASSAHMDPDEQTGRNIWWYMFYEAIITLFFFALTFAYFPNQPPVPPSVSAGQQRIEYRQGIAQIPRNRSLLLVGLSYGLLQGFAGAFGGLLTPIIEKYLPDPSSAEEVVGQYGFYQSLVYIVGGMSCSLIQDRAQVKMKVFLLLLLIGSFVSCCFFAMVCLGVFQWRLWMFYVAGCFLNYFISGTIPLYYELGVETAYPIAEGLAAGFLTILNNIFAFVFLLIPVIPGLGGTSYLVLSYNAGIFVAFLLLIYFKENQKKKMLDLNQ